MWNIRNKAFSLIELMVTVSVLAIVIAIAYPSLSSVIQGNQLLAKNNDLVSALRFARAEAVRLGCDILVKKDYSNYQNNIKIYDLNNKLIKNYNLGKNIDLTFSEVKFNKSGQANEEVLLLLQGNECLSQRYIISIKPHGSIRSQMQSCGE